MISKEQIITHVNFAKGFRGGERQTFLLIEELSKKGYIQRVFTRKKSELALKLQNINNLEIVEISKPYIFSILKVKGSIILHAHETKAAQFVYFANKFLNIPYIITRRVDNSIKNNSFNKKIYKNAKYTVCLSSAIKQTVEEITKDSKIKIIPSASSSLKVDFNNSKKIKERFKNYFLVGNIGELDNNHKGQYYLIEAAKKLQKTHPQIHLLFLGKGKDLENYKKQSQSLKNITFEGFVDNVEDYINCFDLFVFPSLHEGLGSILFDVMKSKVPIIASKVGGIPDIIENEVNGILVESKNSDIIYEKIIELYNNKEKREILSKKSFDKIDDYSSEVMTSKYIKLYEK